jgi:hypothetical protein
MVIDSGNQAECQQWAKEVLGRTAPTVGKVVRSVCHHPPGGQPTTMQPPYDAALRKAVRLRMSTPNRESLAEIAEVGAFFLTVPAPEIVNPGREEQDSASV